MAVKPEDQIPHPVYDWTEWADAEDTEPWDEEREADALKRAKALTAAVWDPTKHPRHPSGTPLGGQFAPITAPGTEFGFPDEGGRGDAYKALNGAFREAYLKEQETYADSMYTSGAGAKREVMNDLGTRLKNDPAWDGQYIRDAFGWPPVDTTDEHTRIFSRDVDKDTAARLVQAWSFTASDSSHVSLLVQQAAAEEFGAPMDLHAITHSHPAELSPIDEARFQRDADALEAMVRTTPQNDPKLDGALRAYVRAQHAATQEMFAKLGIDKDDTVTLYRGMHFEPGKSPFQRGLSVQAITSNPISSWTLGYGTARTFSGVEQMPTKGIGYDSALIAARVPVGRILSTPMSGLGALRETEVVVLGGAADDALVWAHDSGRGVASEEEYLDFVRRSRSIDAAAARGGTPVKFKDEA